MNGLGRSESSLRTTVIVVAVVCGALPVMDADFITPVLVIAGLVSGTTAIGFAARSSRPDKWAWSLLGIGQLLNGVGNLAFIQPEGWESVIGWSVSWAFDAATLLTVLGLCALMAPADDWHRVAEYCIDLIVIGGCAFTVSWSCDLTGLLGSTVGDPSSPLAVMGVTAVLLELLGLAFCIPLLTSRPRRQRLPVIFAGLSLVASTIGDLITTTPLVGTTGNTAPLCWIADSLVIMIGAALVPRKVTQTRSLDRRAPFSLASASVLLTLVLVLGGHGRIDTVTRFGLVVVTLLMVGRQLTIVSTNRRLRRQLERAALTDRLTGLPNRHCFELALADRLRRSGRATVVFCDLDSFKEINDIYGHSYGDRVLAEVAGRLRGSAGPRVVVARFGGDEFTLLLPDGSTAGQAHDLVHSIQSAVSRPLQLDQIQVIPSISAGLTLDDNRTGDEVIVDADLALYAAKPLNRNGFQIFEPQMRTAMITRSANERRLRAAIAAGELSFDMQPIVGFQDDSVRRFEALLRWRDCDGRAVMPPDQVIALAESVGELGRLTEWSLDALVGHAASWSAAGHRTEIAINLTAHQVELPHLADRLLALLAVSEVDPTLVIVEVTEGTLLDAPIAVAHLTQLRAAGVRVAVDDFGTGYSNFTYLVDLPVDELKLDRTFLGEAGTTDRRRTVIQSIVTLAHELGLCVTAEGVENRDHLELAMDLNVDYVQGYFTGPPRELSATGLAELVGAAHPRPAG